MTEPNENVNLHHREGTPPTKPGVTESTTPPEGENVKTPIEEKLEKLESEGKIPTVEEAQKIEAKNKEAVEKGEVVERELTEDEKEVLSKHEAQKAEKEKKQLAQKQQAYKLLQEGAYFMKFIYDDIERQKKENLNRTQRRRFTKELRKGIFSKELVEVYSGKIDVAMDWIDKNLNNYEQTKNKVATHYHMNGFENPEILKALLEVYFDGTFLNPGEEAPEPIDGAKFYEDLKKQETEGKVKDESGDNK